MASLRHFTAESTRTAAGIICLALSSMMLLGTAPAATGANGKDTNVTVADPNHYFGSVSAVSLGKDSNYVSRAANELVITFPRETVEVLDQFDPQVPGWSTRYEVRWDITSAQKYVASGSAVIDPASATAVIPLPENLLDTPAGDPGDSSDCTACYRLKIDRTDYTDTIYDSGILSFIDLVPASEPGAETVNIDLSEPSMSTRTSAFFRYAGSPINARTVSDTFVIDAAPGFFTQRPPGAWRDATAYFTIFAEHEDGSAMGYSLDSSLSADGGVATARLRPDSIRGICAEIAAGATFRLDGSVYSSQNFGDSYSTFHALVDAPISGWSCAEDFSDVSIENLFYKEISWLASRGISSGWTEPNGARTYRALQPVNRDAMAAFMYRLAGEPAFTAPAVSPFADVSPQQQFYKEMAWLASTGISSGWTEPNGARTYRALQPVNRDAMAAFMYRFDDRFVAIQD